MKIGQGLNATGINAGSDVYLECSVQDIVINQFQIKSNSSKASHLITWKHNGKILKVRTIRFCLDYIKLG